MDALQWVRKRGFVKVTQASVTDIPLESDVFEMVFSFDVLQQLSPELGERAIREMHRILKPGGHLFVRAAAFEWLRSSHDEELHTVHRFTRDEMSSKLRRAGFEVEWNSYTNGLLFPIILVRRFLKRFGIGGGTDVRPLPQGLGWLDSIFRRILFAEAWWFKRGGAFAGWSLGSLLRAQEIAAGVYSFTSRNFAFSHWKVILPGYRPKSSTVN
jgi:SAM-dependent methyltransferase